MPMQAGQDESWEAIAETVERELSQRFGPSTSPESIRSAARDSVAKFARQGVRIRTYVPILAGRDARHRLKRLP